MSDVSCLFPGDGRLIEVPPERNYGPIKTDDVAGHYHGQGARSLEAGIPACLHRKEECSGEIIDIQYPFPGHSKRIDPDGQISSADPHRHVGGPEAFNLGTRLCGVPELSTNAAITCFFSRIRTAAAFRICVGATCPS